MMTEGHYVLVYNYDTILFTDEHKEKCIREAVRHSSTMPRGRYEIFRLGKPIKAGTMGDSIKWEE